MTATNISCLTPEGALSGECDFLSANIYARSLFGEGALASATSLVTAGLVFALVVAALAAVALILVLRADRGDDRPA